MKQIRVTYYDKTNCVLLTEDGISSAYEIDLDQIPNQEEFISWIKHLRGKRWLTQEAEKKFIKIVEEKLHLIDPLIPFDWENRNR